MNHNIECQGRKKNLSIRHMQKSKHTQIGFHLEIYFVFINIL